MKINFVIIRKDSQSIDFLDKLSFQLMLYATLFQAGDAVHAV